MTEKPLQPLSHGNVLLVGVKASNFDEEIKNHPRVILWDSQDEKWHNKALPINTQAVFVTRWIGHAPFAEIIKEARNKHITIFNPQGTGMIARQVRELLSLNHSNQIEKETKVNQMTNDEPKVSRHVSSKLHVLEPFLDFNKSHVENGKILLEKARELNIKTNERSLAQWAYQQRKKAGLPAFRKATGYDGRTGRAVGKISPKPSDDVTVQMFDNLLKEMHDMRDLFIKTMAENAKLKSKLEKFKRFFEE